MIRSLVVTRWDVWPPTSGARQRSANVIAALAELGEIDLFLLADPRHAAPLQPPASLRIGRVGRAERSDVRVGRGDELRTLLPGSRPAITRVQDDRAARAAFSAWGPGTYDLVWFARVESWLTLGDLVAGPAVVDYDDLRDQLVRSRLRSAWPDPPRLAGRSSAARRWLRRRMMQADARAWSRLQATVAREVAAVIVCSDLDRDRLGVANARVVPNGVKIPAVSAGREAIGTPPVLCLQGTLGYGPNADAATLLVRDIAPRVRAELGDVEVRLVGRVDDRVSHLGQEPGVVVTGHVDDIETELAKADVVAVPLREGGGTRIKVLEALAHRVPVVATSIAVEGLDLASDVHLLVADDPASFASACVLLLRDRRLRARLVDAGELLVRERHSGEHARAAVATVARGVVGATSAG